MISEHVYIRTTISARILIYGPMHAAVPPDSLQRSQKASLAIPGPYKIPTALPYNPPDQLHRMPFGARCRLPIGCIGRQRHPSQSGYRTRPFSVRRIPVILGVAPDQRLPSHRAGINRMRSVLRRKAVVVLIPKIARGFEGKLLACIERVLRLNRYRVFVNSL